MINKGLIQKNFERIGTKVSFREMAPRNLRAANALPMTMDVKHEEFEIVYDPKRALDLSVLDILPRERHLLLLAKVPKLNSIGQKVGEEKFKLLCGHDERHYFSCGVPEKGVTRVVDAKRALMPEVVKETHLKVGRAKNLLKRKNEASVRQGEWFFVRRAGFVPARLDWIKRNEPISRGRGSKSHFCEELYNIGGEGVYVHPTYAPDGVNKEELERLRRQLKHNIPQIRFEMRTRNAEVYVRGKISHIDHPTIRLDCWHQVFMNTENKSKASTISVFLD